MADPRPVTDNQFELLPSPDLGYWQFRVARSDANLAPDSAIAAGTLYSATALVSRPLVNRWGAYVAAQTEKADGGHTWQYFVRALPTTAAVEETLDNALWGKVWRHSYLDLLSNSRPDRGDDYSTATSAVNVTLNSGATLTLNAGGNVELQSIRYVLDVQEQDMGQGLCKVMVDTVASKTLVVQEDGVNEVTGIKETITKTWTLSGTKPEGAGVNSSGVFTIVGREGHNLWLSTTRPVSGYPVGQANALTWDTLGRMYWPAVMKAFRWTQVWDSVALKFKRLLSYSMKDPYAGDVPLTIAKWWQKDEFVIPVPADLSARSIQVRGHLNSFVIPECLHGPFYYLEQNYIAETVGVPTYRNVMMSWWFTSTPNTDWPATFTRISQEPRNGGFDVTQETFTAPPDVIGFFNTGIGATGSTFDTEGLYYRDWTTTDGDFYA